MASLQTNTYQGRYIKLTVTEESTDISSNKSVVRWKLESVGGSHNYYSIYNWSVKVHNTQVYNKQTTSWDSYTFPAAKGETTGTIDVPHGSDGNGFDIGFQLTGVVYNGGEATYNGTIRLSDIPRTSNVSLPNGTTLTTNSSARINTNRASGTSFTHTITYQVGNASGTIATDVGEYTNWTPPRSLAQQQINDTKINGTIYCNTYNGGTYIGQSSVNFTLNFDSAIKPSITFNSVIDGNDNVRNKNLSFLLTNLSYLKANFTGTGSQNSTISKYNAKITIPNSDPLLFEGTSLENLNSLLKNATLKAEDGQKVEFWVTDSRNRSSNHSSQTTFNVKAYTLPSITGYNAIRCDSNGNEKDDGTYIKVTLNASITSLDNSNKFTVKIGYKLKTDENYTYHTIYNESTSDSSINTTNYVPNDITISTSSSYDIEFFVSDLFSNNTRYKEIGTGFDLMHFNASGKSVAFGKKSEAGPNESKAEFGFDVDFLNGLFINSVKTLWYNVSNNTKTLNMSNDLKNLILNNIYPVGSIYISAKYISPASIFGGTWTQLKSRYIYASGQTSGDQGKDNMSESTGTSVTGTAISVDQMPAHAHSAGLNNGGEHVHNLWFGGNAGSGTGAQTVVCSNRWGQDTAGMSTGWHDHGGVWVQNNGGGQAHSHDVPYISVYVWQRTA